MRNVLRGTLQVLLANNLIFSGGQFFEIATWDRSLLSNPNELTFTSPQLNNGRLRIWCAADVGSAARLAAYNQNRLPLRTASNDTVKDARQSSQSCVPGRGSRHSIPARYQSAAQRNAPDRG